ncbi:MAG: hypothetical protein A2Z35_03600 [Actinobacteria bacterium RBG_19FT_COMBO_36_27]|nr:MAG: hypothetical protein A2Z35_03600 [Actinobacteria bacterium RBG_19FT_COMBO_36_27]
MDNLKKVKSKTNKDDYYLNKEISLSENAVKVLERRYLKRDEEGILLENPRDMFIRVARNIASAEKNYGKTEEEIKEIEKQFFDIMTDLDFLPNSPTLMNAGKELQQLAACFVLPVGDSMNDIFEALKETALIQKSGGGVGYSFSNIRPRNDVVLSTKGVSSGPISFMTVFNAATDTIKQGGTRRGANMGILRVDHPDILDFIISKENNEKLTNFNISVGVTEKFMKAVENDEEYEIINPRTKEVVDKYRAKEIFNKIVVHAWKNGDPGIIFLDRLNKDNPTPHLGQIESTNPCVSGETLISTDKGFIEANELYKKNEAGEDIKILFDKRALEYKVSNEFANNNLDIFESRDIRSWNRGMKDTYKLVTYSGYELEATPEHKILTTGGYKKLGELTEGDEILIQPMGKFPVDKKIFNNGKVIKLNNFTNRKTLRLPEYWSGELGEIIGWLIGDGWLREDRVGFTFGDKDREVSLYFKQIIKEWYNYDVKEIIRENRVIHLSYHSKGFIEFFKELGVKAWVSREKEVPVSLLTAPKEASIGFLRGIFSSDGNVDDTDGTIKISSSSRKLLKGIQMLLLGLGIKSNILDRKYSFSKNFSYIKKNGENKSYKAKDDSYYELFISGGISRRRFQEEVGFILERKNKLLDSFKFGKLSSNNYYNKFIDKVTEVKYAGKKEVFDFNEPLSNSYIANGIVVRNCGEQPLLPYEACNLGSINLANMVKEEDGIKKIDFDKLRRLVYTAVRFLDDVIDMSKYPLEKIMKMARGNRKIGLGVMGYADLLIILGIPYDSEEALELAQKIMSFIQDESKNASKEMAKEKGAFPNIKGSVYDTPDGYEIRNATTTTIAPTGTLSIIADCSSGVEPLFAISFVKNVMDNDRLVEVNKYFKKSALDEGFYSEGLMEKMAEKGNLKDIDGVPSKYKRIFITAHEISPTWHVRTQAAFQKFVDNAVSKTVNFPHNATIQDVENAYMLAYRLGCKGITIFRDKSRGAQVLEVEGKKKDKSIGVKEAAEKEVAGGNGRETKKGSPPEMQEKAREEIKETKLKPRPRPEVTHGMTKKYKIGNCGKLYVTVNSDENGICEVFINTGEEGCTALTEAVGRLISIAIRSGIDIESVKKQVEGIRCVTCIADPETHVLSCPDAMAKAIGYYLNGSNKFDLSITSGPRSIMICPEEGCGGIMEPEGGCYICRTCGFSKCS